MSPIRAVTTVGRLRRLDAREASWSAAVRCRFLVSPPASPKRQKTARVHDAGVWLHPLAGSALAVLAFLLGACAVPAAPLRVATFRCDVTPPPGEPLVWATNLIKVESPLLAKGVLLEDGTNRYVLCALDWCLLCNDSERSFRRSLASGAGTEASRVAIHSVHQHAAPYADEGAHRLLDAAPSPLPHLSGKFLDEVRRRLAGAAADAASRLQPFDQVGIGQAEVERVASIRRLRSEEGKPLTRYSTSGKLKDMADAPEGDIDPMVRTVTFARAGKPLVRLHYYATHPQTFCCDGRASSDFVGAAREALEQAEGVPQIYFTGCGSDVTVGKYNDTSAQAYSDLTERLTTGLKASLVAARYTPATALVWRTDVIILPLHEDAATIRAQSRSWLEDSKRSDGFRAYEGAMRLAFIDRLDRPVDVSSLQVGAVWILNLPGEPMLEFQRFAQRARPGAFVAVAGYGDCGPAYICTDQAIAEGGYEPTAANVGRGSEARLKQAIQRLLDLSASPADPSVRAR